MSIYLNQNYHLRTDITETTITDVNPFYTYIMINEKTRYAMEEEKAEELLGTIDHIFSQFHLEDLRQQLSLFFTLVNDGHFDASIMKKKQLKSLCKALHEILEGCYELYRIYTKDGLVIEECEQKLIKRPFSQQVPTSAYLFEQKIQIHQGKIIFLDYEESLDIYLFFERFFSYDSVIKWKQRVEIWERCVLRGVMSLHDSYGDFDIFISYTQLQKLIEAAYLSCQWGLRSLPNSPIASLFHRKNQPYYITVKAMFNPFEYLNHFFQEDNATSLKKKLRIWLDAANTVDKIWNYGEPADLIHFHDYFQSLMETGLIITHCDFIFQNWMNKNTWIHKHDPKKEGGGYILDNHHLTDEEVETPYLAINEIFLHHFNSIRDTLRAWLGAALSKDTIEDRDDYHLKIMRAIEALYLLNVQVYFGVKSYQS